jgi:hypothetical protein
VNLADSAVKLKAVADKAAAASGATPTSITEAVVAAAEAWMADDIAANKVGADSPAPQHCCLPMTPPMPMTCTSCSPNTQSQAPAADAAAPGPTKPPADTAMCSSHHPVYAPPFVVLQLCHSNKPLPCGSHHSAPLHAAHAADTTTTSPATPANPKRLPQAIGAAGAAALVAAAKARGKGDPTSGKLRVLTHCNTGSLATAAYGTALGVIRALQEGGQLEHAYCTETRPYNQGEGCSQGWEGEWQPHAAMAGGQGLQQGAWVDVGCDGGWEGAAAGCWGLSSFAHMLTHSP